MVWYVDKTDFQKIHFTGDSVFDIMEGDDVQEKLLNIYRVNAFIQRRCSLLRICRNSTFKCILVK